MSSQNHKNNHFVPKFYLKNFLASGLLYQYDTTNNKFYSKTEKELKKVASAKNLYSLHGDTKISDSEFALFCQLCELNHEENHLHTCLKEFLNNNIYDFDKNHYLKNTNISRNQEELFSSYENSFKNILEGILTEEDNDFRFYQHCSKAETKHYLHEKIMNIITSKSNFKNNTYIDLIHYIVVQYFRTKKRFSALLATMKNTENLTTDSIKKLNGTSTKGLVSLFIHYAAITITWKTIEDYHIVLLKSSKSSEFITSDMPCINTYVNENKRKLNDSEFEIFFPLSPKLALLYTKKKKYLDNQNIVISGEKVSYYNNKILKMTERYLYGNKKAIEKITNCDKT